MGEGGWALRELTDALGSDRVSQTCSGRRGLIHSSCWLVFMMIFYVLIPRQIFSKCHISNKPVVHSI